MYKQKILKSGLKMVSVPVAGTKTVTVIVLVAAGSKYEDKNNNGISHFLEHMFFKGTKKRPNTLAIASELDAIGAEFNAFTSKEYSGYWIKADSAKIELATDMINDMLLNSKFSEAEINRERGTIIEEINMYEDNPIMKIETVFEECLYGDTPAGWDTIGTKENILKFSRKDFIEYLKSHYGADKIVVCFAGKLSGKLEKFAEHFERHANSKLAAEKREVIEYQEQPQIKISFKKTDQATISLGVRAFPMDHKDETILRLLAIILGGSMSSRMFTQVRERRGLAYHIRTSAEFYTDSGYLATHAGVPVNKIDEAIATIIQEYKKICKTLVSDKELKRNKDLIRGRSILELEASDSMANWYGKQALFRKKIMEPEEYFRKIDKISAEDLRRVAKEIFKNDRLNLAIIGPFEDQKRFEKILKF